MNIVVRRLTEADVARADIINRLAFGAFFGLADPLTFRGDGDTIGGRLRTDPDGAFAAELDGELVASGLLMNWGSVGILGPLTVHPDHWGHGIARHMMAPMIDEIDRRNHEFVGLITHPQSPSHIRLYEAHGFWMERITGVMAKPVDPGVDNGDWGLISGLSGGAAERAFATCRRIADSNFPGLDLTHEIRAVNDRGLGEVVLLERKDATVGFAICHHGPGTEGGSAEFRIKFGAVTRGGDAPDDFRRLVAACECAAAERGATQLAAGANSGRAHAYRILQEAGMRTTMNGVAMMRPGTEGYNRPDVFVTDDWR